MEVVLNGDESVGGIAAVVGAEVVADVREEDRVDALEVAVADVVCLRSQEFFCHAIPDFECAGDVVLDHDVFDRERGDDVDGVAGVVAFAVAGRAEDDGIVIRDAGLLRGLRNAVDVRAERDGGAASTVRPRSHVAGGDAGDAALDLEAVLLQQVAEVLRGLELLKPELAVAVEGIDHDLDELGVAVDLGEDFLLERIALIFF